ncbi:aromatic acid exporter family protein [Micromonospora sediminicola]|uniref:aromatic acid exporter family protein n=1 Tax=Micromonospora sediminicola TaxID=946078 RepID=UPI0037AD9326
MAVQAGLAAVLAWVVAREVLGNPQPTFAPLAAVGVIGSAVGSRARRTVELIAGVVVGIAVGDLLVAVLGTGPWQTGVIVFAAIAVVAVARGSGALMVQTGGTAVLVATLTPTAPDLELPRTTNALVGGAVGLVVVLVLAPLNPVRAVRRVADYSLNRFASEMTASATALTRRDAGAAERVLDRMRDADAELSQITEVVTAADEVARLSPLRWRRRRSLAAYRQGVEHLDRAFRNSRALVRRLSTALRDDEPVPRELPVAVEQLGEAIRMLHREFLAAHEPLATRERVLEAVRHAGAACRQDMGFSGTIVVSQTRLVANDILRATGLPRDTARRMVRHAAAGN